ncbi:50S ribosomal protein L16 [Candidatus Wolfebacteria bacterium CG10_big_fil_rev_8_21_14_0_10_31_9]|uniref:Large ribosomal subunit protein uL16 n=1 Tax=Candidatus Wolfebacteria bacterium CG10_big_fil_rev_8_21_14_0_10_31_9 TaxID=1975070 RepID=A0A2H0RC80_9BACT|nr:MAG: 50S ribosomal protein L16 [Candidatus Wolfebacteria bacterium CG10_big_fil_rev_8_21_14_0_10_31_9]
MLLPKKVKHRKWQKGRSKDRKVENRGLNIDFGSFGLQSLECAWITSRQIEASRKSITHFTKREGKLWIRIFPDKPVTKKPPEVTLGGGKGSVEYYVFPVRIGRVIFEIDGVKESVAREALRRAGHKLPIKTRFITK